MIDSPIPAWVGKIDSPHAGEGRHDRLSWVVDAVSGRRDGATSAQVCRSRRGGWPWLGGRSGSGGDLFGQVDQRQVARLIRHLRSHSVIEKRHYWAVGGKADNRRDQMAISRTRIGVSSARPQSDLEFALGCDTSHP
ncbi:hypothetical protein OG271_19695 [Micromonospora rifamycinica]|uniref:hypothetical protein n=1 Tax=Micromonospora rifamycinica TaxID=291594 RepID=UPI002E2CB7D6|nr:hypothetical protein [Micromonospora rifamycinica]